MPSTVCGTASRLNCQVEFGAVLALNSGRPGASRTGHRRHATPAVAEHATALRHSGRPSNHAPREGLREPFSAAYARIPAAADNPRTLSSYLTKVARLGGYMARAKDPPPGNAVMWRGLSRLTDIKLGAMLANTAAKCGESKPISVLADRDERLIACTAPTGVSLPVSVS